MTLDLFDAADLADAGGWTEPLADGAAVLRRFALPAAPVLLAAVGRIAAAVPFRQLTTPGGRRMAVATTSCGALGWTSDQDGYRYVAADPRTGNPWPPMPDAFRALAAEAASAAGFAGFVPDACLINRYLPGARLSLHQDRDERDVDAPIVSVSLGLPAVFLFGGMQRGDRAVRVPLAHGDVAVWGGPARLRFHGVLPLKDGTHPATGEARINLTFRKAG
ncbi:MAG: DNA oxidative demethylase AlkB [Burkholderiaceae bacterium]